MNNNTLINCIPKICIDKALNRKALSVKEINSKDTIAYPQNAYKDGGIETYD